MLLFRVLISSSIRNFLYFLFVNIFKFAYMGKFRWPHRSVPIPTTYHHFRPANIILQPQPQPQPGWTSRAGWVLLRPSLLSWTGWGWGRLRLRHSLLGWSYPVGSCPSEWAHLTFSLWFWILWLVTLQWTQWPILVIVGFWLS